MNSTIIDPVRHGLLMAVMALIFGALWAAYMATHHEQLHRAFVAQEENLQQVEMQHEMDDMSMENMQMDVAADHKHSSTTPDNHHHEHDAASHAIGGQHSHSGSLAQDAMQRLLRGHIHFMGIGVLAGVLLLITAFTSLRNCWKKTLGFTFGLGALAYPPAWILMGFRTVDLGPDTAEASVLWLFGPAVGLLLASMAVLLGVLLIEMAKLNEKRAFQFLFESEQKEK